MRNPHLVEQVSDLLREETDVSKSSLNALTSHGIRHWTVKRTIAQTLDWVNGGLGPEELRAAISRLESRVPT